MERWGAAARQEKEPRVGKRPQGRVLPEGESAPAIPVERVVDACECILDLAAAFFDVSGRELRRPGRGTDEVSRVRQIAMYATHVVLGFSMADIGKGFGRDRTTVMHACHMIEDLRDNAEADEIVARMERVVAAAFRGHRLR